MANVPGDLKYRETHEWVRVEDGVATVGISEHAADELGDVVFVELPESGATFGAGDSFGTVESVKAVSDLYAPVGGEVVEVNEGLSDAPEKINDDPYGDGWIVRLRVTDDATDLLSPDDYEKHIAEG